MFLKTLTYGTSSFLLVSIQFILTYKFKYDHSMIYIKGNNKGARKKKELAFLSDTFAKALTPIPAP